MARPVIAVVNNDTQFLTLMKDLLSDEGYQAFTWIEGDTAHEMIKHEQPDLVILDIRMESPESGWKVLELLRLDPTTAEIPVIVCSADAVSLRSKADHLKKLRCEVLEKPFDLDELLAKVAAFVGPPPVHGEHA